MEDKYSRTVTAVTTFDVVVIDRVVGKTKKNLKVLLDTGSRDSIITRECAKNGIKIKANSH